MLFDSFEAYDVQEIRRTSREEGWEEGWNDGIASTLIAQIQKKFLKGKNLEDTADELEETPEKLREFYDIVAANPDGTPEELLKIWKSFHSNQ
ncbi:hypothetical protein ACQRBN_11465 [Bariatricus sp. SGI.154]|uniref:hypothetical protein n=1 Tax=Bariatricus sp. SGI.154 TaxID=3420549 RepID=UPI003D062389